MKLTVKKAILAILTVALVIVAVMGWVWTDYAETKFWWTFWEVAAIAAVVILVVGWAILWNSSGKKRDS